MRRTLLFLFVLGISLCTVFGQQKPATGRAADNYVRILDEKGRVQRFVIQTRPVFELKNGSLNILVRNDSNELFEITGIPESLLKDTTIKNHSLRLDLARAMLIKQNMTYVTQPKRFSVELRIRCTSPKKGMPVRIYLRSKIYHGKSYCTAEALLSGIVPEPQFMQTNKINK